MKFVENVFPFSHSISSNTTSTFTNSPPLPDFSVDLADSPSPQNFPSPSAHIPSTSAHNSPPSSPAPTVPSPVIVPSQLGQSTTDPAPVPLEQPPTPLVLSDPPELGRGLREKRPSVLLRDFVTNTVHTLSPSHRSPSDPGSSGTSYPITHYVNCTQFSKPHRIFFG